MSRQVRPPVGSLVYAGMASMVAIGLGLALTGAWRTGIALTGIALVVAAGCRAVVPERMAGLLRVRRRTSDTAALVALGAALLVLAVIVPTPPDV